jgi:beta-lactam-binding protein with PASTA domain
MLFVGVMAAAAWFVFDQAVEGGAHVVVPDVVGWPVDKAQLALSKSGLELGRQTQVTSDQYPEYHVMLQRPSANDVVRQGRKVSVTISAGRQSEEAPNLVGKTFQEAIQDLGTTRLLVGRMASMNSDAPKGMVLAQDPGRGRLLEVGTEVSLLVSDGPAVQTVFMPQLVQLSLEEARKLLEPLKLNVEPFAVEDTAKRFNLVLTQTPPAGTTMDEGDTVTFDIRLLPDTVLPNVRHRVTFSYFVPDMPTRPSVRIIVIDRNNGRRTEYPRPGDYVGGTPPHIDPRTELRITIEYIDRATVEFYVDGRLERSYRYEEGAGPEVTIMDAASLREGSQTPSMESQLVTGFEPRAVRVGQ